MGTSKITLISGMYIVLGLYISGFNTADDASSNLAVSSAVSVQTEQIAQSGVSLALVRMGNNNTYTAFSTQKTTMGGTVTYSASKLPSSESQIISIATLVSGSKTTTVKTTSIASFEKGLWRISRTFVENL